MKKLSLLGYFTFSAIFSFSQWTWQNPLPQGNQLDCIQMIDANTCFASGHGGTIMKTTNGGINWSVLNSGTTATLSAISLPAPNIGFAVGSGGTAIKTNDGGTSWTLLNTLSNTYLRSLFFSDSTTGCAVGDNGEIIQTTNGGKNWSVQYLNDLQCNVNCVWIKNADTGYIALQDGTIAKKVNNISKTWYRQSTRNNNPLYSLYFFNVDTGYAVGGSGTILKTNDGGTTWAKLTSGTGKPLYSVSFIDYTTGYILGDNVILKTTNGGANWGNQYLDSIGLLLSRSFHDANTGFAVGKYGTIMKTTDGSANWIKQNHSVTTDRLYPVCFPSPDTGYILSYSGALLKTM
ncbi:MAG: YCF48-related protein, partial [Bacteroidota bacterium]